jgi:hypothetical protein
MALIDRIVEDRLDVADVDVVKARSHEQQQYIAAASLQHSGKTWTSRTSIRTIMWISALRTRELSL